MEIVVIRVHSGIKIISTYSILFMFTPDQPKVFKLFCFLRDFPLSVVIDKENRVYSSHGWLKSLRT